ncbi:hypothetical protein SAMN05443244_0985 [Terriglobus roseus]|uniref:Uncharacterized protein n=1 Tax=Terriglobus roseus TaxID=392734 RepID=A0A1H4K3U6_9BACT|nr:hypothetical protein SAMN05443244_0985 [Terriglobus roseus]
MSPATRELAERLIAHEAALDLSLRGESSDTCRVCEKLRRSLEKHLGPGAYSSLATLALGLAKREAPILEAVQITESGSIKGLTGEAVNANSILIAQFIELMKTFIGETVTLWLVDDIWPGLPTTNASGPKSQ